MKWIWPPKQWEINYAQRKANPVIEMMALQGYSFLLVWHQHGMEKSKKMYSLAVCDRFSWVRLCQWVEEAWPSILVTKIIFHSPSFPESKSTSWLHLWSCCSLDNGAALLAAEQDPQAGPLPNWRTFHQAGWALLVSPISCVLCGILCRSWMVLQHGQHVCRYRQYM